MNRRISNCLGVTVISIFVLPRRTKRRQRTSPARRHRPQGRGRHRDFPDADRPLPDHSRPFPHQPGDKPGGSCGRRLGLRANRRPLDTIRPQAHQGRFHSVRRLWRGARGRTGRHRQGPTVRRPWIHVIAAGTKLAQRILSHTTPTLASVSLSYPNFGRTSTGT